MTIYTYLGFLLFFVTIHGAGGITRVMERNIYENPVRAAEEGNTHTAISVDSYSWKYRDKPVKVRILYRRGDYELRFAGAPSIRVPDVNADRVQLMDLISRCRKWRAVNWL